MKVKKIPMRMCLGCGEMFSKKDLIRAVKDKEGNISLDFTGKKAGRGAYLCKKQACFMQMRKTRRLERTFATAIPDEVYARMEEELSNEC